MALNPEILVNTRVPAPYQGDMFQSAQRSHAYALGTCYPRYAFSPPQFPIERGQTPTPIPTPAIILNEGAEFLFRGGAPKFTVPFEDNAALEPADEWLRKKVIQANRLGEQYVSLAESCGHQGALAAKFSYDDSDTERPIRVSFLTIPDQCRVWFDPMDQSKPIFARIQYPYRDLSSGDWYYFREEWTDDLHVTYEPLRAAGRDEVSAIEQLPGYLVHLGDDGTWIEAGREKNPFEVIPVTLIRNKRIHGNPLGEGDLWRWFRIVDRIALTLHDSDRWNQINSVPNTVILNADDDPTTILPGEVTHLHKDNPQGGDPDMKILEPMGYARQWVDRYVDRMEKYAWEAAGYSYIDLAQIGNKGAWTELAFEVTFARTIATTDKKRELWGNSGLCVFFRHLLQAMARIGGFKELSGVDDETEVSVDWGPYFAPTPQDIGELTERTVTQIGANLLTTERGADRIARAEGIPDHEIPVLLQELEDEAAEVGNTIAAPQIVVAANTRKVSEKVSPAVMQEGGGAEEQGGAAVG